MSSFPLKIVTPDGLIFDGQAEKLILRTIVGDMAILAGHIDFVSPLGMGQAVVEADGKRRTAACIGGLVRVRSGEVTLVPTTFEWAEDIDAKRAETAQERAEAMIAQLNAKGADIDLAEARLKRALIRRSVAQNHTSR